MEWNCHTYIYYQCLFDFTAFRNLCRPGGQTGATGLGWFPNQTGTGLFGESHTICRSASRCWHVQRWTNGFSSRGQVRYRRSWRAHVQKAYLHVHLLITVKTKWQKKWATTTAQFETFVSCIVWTWLCFIHAHSGLYTWGTMQWKKETVLKNCFSSLKTQWKNILWHHQVRKKPEYNNIADLVIYCSHLFL